MLVVFDASFLVALLDPKIKGIDEISPRLEYLIKNLEASKSKIIIPTPALSEVLVGAGDAASKYLELIHKSSQFKIASFSERAAIEVAAAHREAINAGDKKEGSGDSWQKVKFDRQIIAIAKVEGASKIYSNDLAFLKYCKRDNIEVITLEQLPLPPENDQKSLKF
jgi:predicted nucleic acid-binding protein